MIQFCTPLVIKKRYWIGTAAAAAAAAAAVFIQGLIEVEQEVQSFSSLRQDRTHDSLGVV
jgi:hypothetical protein